MCVYIEMRPILCTKTHILCAATCAHSFCNKHRLFVFSFLIYIYTFLLLLLFLCAACVFFFLRHSHHWVGMLLMPLCGFSVYIEHILNFDTAAFELHRIASDTFFWLFFSFRAPTFIFDLITDISSVFKVPA